MQKRMKPKALISMLLAAAMLCGVLAGCKGADNPGDNPGGSSEAETALNVETTLKNTKLEGEKDDSQHRITTLLTFTPEPAGHGHPMVEGGPDWSLQPLIYESLCDYSSQSDNNFDPQLLESFEVDGKVLTMKLREGLKYSDGSEINADEILNNMFMDMSLQQIMVYAESIEKLDDLTIRITYTKDSQVVRTYLLKSLLMYPTSEYGKWGDVFRDIFENMRVLNDDGDYKLTEEGQKLFDENTLDLNAYLPRMTEIKTSGPYYISTVTSDEITLSANPYYRNKLDIDTIVGIRQSSAESFQIAVQNGEMDLEAGGLSTELALRIAQESKDTIRQVGVPFFAQWGFCIFPARGAYASESTPGWNLAFIGDVLYHAALPVLTYFLTTVASWVMGMKSICVGLLGEDYMNYARARGLSRNRILFTYLGRNAMLPQITSLAISFGLLFGGSPVIENLFVYPGVGYYLNSAISRRDYPLMQGMFLMIIVMVLISGLAADALNKRLNPRLREKR